MDAVGIIDMDADIATRESELADMLCHLPPGDASVTAFISALGGAL